MSSPNYEDDEARSPKFSSGQTTPLDLSEDDDAFWARRPSFIVPPQDTDDYMRRRCLDLSHRYDAIQIGNFEATDTSQQTPHIPEPAEDDAEANHAIRSLQDARSAQTSYAYQQTGLGRVFHCMWCGVADGQAHKVDCSYPHYLFSERGLLRDAKAPVLLTLFLLEATSPLVDVHNPDIAIQLIHHTA